MYKRYNAVCPAHIIGVKGGINIVNICFIEKCREDISMNETEKIANELFKIFAKYF